MWLQVVFVRYSWLLRKTNLKSILFGRKDTVFFQIKSFQVVLERARRTLPLPLLELFFIQYWWLSKLGRTFKMLTRCPLSPCMLARANEGGQWTAGSSVLQRSSAVLIASPSVIASVDQQLKASKIAWETGLWAWLWEITLIICIAVGRHILTLGRGFWTV